MNIISISGPQCNGKSSVFNEIKDELKNNEKFVFFSEFKDLKEKSIDYLDDRKFDSFQLSCLSYDLEVLRISQSLPKDKIVITERGIVDTYIYTKYLYNKGKVSEITYEIIKSNYLLNRSKYVAFFIPTHFDLKSDVDSNFRDELYNFYYKEYSGTQFHWISGSMFIRVGHFYDLLKYYFKEKPRTLKKQEDYELKYLKGNMIPQQKYKR